jgi:hypothetical protein
MSSQEEIHPNRSHESTAGRAPAGESIDSADATSNNNAGTASSLRRREKESLILQELSLTLHTLQNLSTVLEDIVRLTTSGEDTADNPSKDSVAVKQRLLLRELHEWKHLLRSKKVDSTSSETGNEDRD